MIVLDGSMERVIIQFKLKDPGELPKVARQMARNRKNQGRESGEKLIEHTPDVSLTKFVRELEAVGFDLVDLLHDERGLEGMGAYQVYHVGRFVFVRKELVHTALESGQANLARIELHLLCAKSLWRVCGYVNPIRRNGEVVTGMHEVSINLDSRRPLSDNEGNPVRIWEKPKSRRSPGEQPALLEPKHWLSVRNSAIDVVPVPVSVEQKAEPADVSSGPAPELIATETNREIPTNSQTEKSALELTPKNPLPLPLRMNYEPMMPRWRGGIRKKSGK